MRTVEAKPLTILVYKMYFIALSIQVTKAVVKGSYR